jgi:hypothetical protein
MSALNRWHDFGRKHAFMYTLKEKTVKVFALGVSLRRHGWPVPAGPTSNMH